MKLYSILIALLLVSCASAPRVIPIDYQFSDFPEERRIEFRFKNELQETLCLLPESWPNRAGKINQASGYVFLIIDGKRFPIEDFNTGYCPEANGCAIRVGPGEEASASIPYYDFNIPEELTEMTKILEFSPVAVKCR